MAVGKVRLKDVAEKAGVAVNTASTILNRRPNSWASKETEERVFAAAKELGYRPNRAAVALQAGCFKTIGLLIADLENPYYTHFSEVFGNQIESRGYDLLIENWRTDLQREKKLLEDFVHRNVDGVVAFVSDIEEHREFLESQTKAGFPIVALAMPGPDEMGLDMVTPNFGPGLREAASILHGLGHRKFAFLAAKSGGQRVGKRPALFRELIDEYGDSELEVVDSGPTLKEARDLGHALLSKENRPTAIVGLNDLAAIGVMRAAKDLGLKVPEDVSVVGIDGIPLAEQLVVSLSTIAQPHEEMVAKAIEFLMARIDSDEVLAPQRADFPTRFIKRESVGPPR
ncbi:MAG: LacI family DNA-binding transcriptional regulator [Verrucomicrobiaceae bacterium]